MDGLSKQTVIRDGNYVVSDGYTIQSTTIVVKVESERSNTSVIRIFNHHQHYPLIFKRGMRFSFCILFMLRADLTDV
jgi:hypothetical protein